MSDNDNCNEVGSNKKGLVKRFVNALRNAPTKLSISQSSLQLERSKSQRSYYPHSELFTLPGEIPDDLELNEMAMQVIKETVGESKICLETIQKMPRESKWQMVCSSGKVYSKYTPDQITFKFKEVDLGTGKSTGFLNKELINALRIQLTNQPLSWVREFVEKGGSSILVEGLKEVYYAHKKSGALLEVMDEWLKAIKAFTNNNIGLQVICDSQDLLNAIALHIDHRDIQLRLIPIHIFTVVSYSDPPNSALKVIEAMGFLRDETLAESRFDKFIKIMSDECRFVQSSAADEKRKVTDSIQMITDGMIFVNAIIDNLEDLDMRLFVRSGIYRDPFNQELLKLKNLQNSDINGQVDLLYSMFQSDAEIVMSRYKRMKESFIEPKELLQLLLTELQGTGGTIDLTSLLQHLVSIQILPGSKARYIRLLDRTLEQILLLKKGLDPDFSASPLPYFSAKEIERFLCTDEIDALRQENMRLRFELTLANEKKSSLLLSLDSTSSTMSKEVGELKCQLQKMSLDYSTEIGKLKSEAVEKEKQIENIKNESNATVSLLNQELISLKKNCEALEGELSRLKLEQADLTKQPLLEISNNNAINEGSLRRDSCPSPPVMKISPTTPTAPIAPRPPPPPPPPGRGLNLKTNLAAKSVNEQIKLKEGQNQAEDPKPQTELKPQAALESVASNGSEVESSTPNSYKVEYPQAGIKIKNVLWTKIFPKEYTGSVWEGFDAPFFENKVDFHEIDELFPQNIVEKDTSVVVKVDNDPTTIIDDKMKMQIGKETRDGFFDTKFLAVVAKQLSPEYKDSLIQALEGMNEQPFLEIGAQIKKCCEIDTKTVEKIVDYLHSEEPKIPITNDADVLIFKFAQVRGFPIRLKFLLNKIEALTLIKNQNEMIHINIVALKNIKDCSRLQRVLWLLLYVGNYLNQGTPRGDALGFLLKDIKQFKSVKSFDQQEEGMNLLMFIVKTIQKQFPDLLNLPTDLSLIKAVIECQVLGLDHFERKIDEHLRVANCDLYKIYPCPEHFNCHKCPIDQEKDTFELAIYEFIESTKTEKERTKKLNSDFISLRREVFSFYTTRAGDLEDFYSSLISFADDFKTCLNWVEEQEKLSQKEKLIESTFRSSGKSKAVAGILNDHSDKRGLVDSVMSTLRSR